MQMRIVGDIEQLWNNIVMRMKIVAAAEKIGPPVKIKNGKGEVGERREKNKKENPEGFS